MSLTYLNSRLAVSGARLRAAYLAGSVTEVMMAEDQAETSSSASVQLVLPALAVGAGETLPEIEVLRIELHHWARSVEGALVSAAASIAHDAAVVHRRRCEKSLVGTKYIRQLLEYLQGDLSGAGDLSLVLYLNDEVICDEYEMSPERVARAILAAVERYGDTEPLRIELQGAVKGKDKRWFVGVSYAATGDDVLVAARAAAAIHALCDAVGYACDVW